MSAAEASAQSLEPSIAEPAGKPWHRLLAPFAVALALFSAFLTFVVLTGLTPIAPTHNVVVTFLLINGATILLLLAIILGLYQAAIFAISAWIEKRLKLSRFWVLPIVWVAVEWGRDKSGFWLSVLNDHYLGKGNAYLLGDRITIADYLGAGFVSAGAFDDDLAALASVANAHGRSHGLD